MTQYFLSPVDVWMFRDGKPFDVGLGQRAFSTFPPSSLVVQGAIRSYQLALKGVNLHDRRAIEAVVGTTENYLDFRMRGPYLAKKDGEHAHLYFSLPLDAKSVKEKRNIIEPASLPEAGKTPMKCCQPDYWLIGLQDEMVKSSGGAFIDELNLEKYLKREQATVTLEKNLFDRELRTGIGMDAQTRVTKKSALYEIEFIRPKPEIGLLIDIQGYDDFPQKGYLKLGGDGRGCYFEQVKNNFMEAQNSQIEITGRFKICFISPAWFENGWAPASWQKFFNGKVTLKSAAVGKYISVGGFDYAKNWHKPTKRFVPAGSVYYFEADGDVTLQKTLIQGALTEWGAEIGFGQFILSKEW